MSNTTKQSSLRQDTIDRPTTLSRSASAASSHGNLRPKSRGSTTSLQSVGIGNAFQPVVQQTHDQHAPIDQTAYYPISSTQPNTLYPSPIEDPNMISYHQAHMQHMRHTSLSQHDMRPMSQHSYHTVQTVPMQFADPMQSYAMSTQHAHHMRHASEQYDSAAHDDSNNENGGGKRRKGTASSMANDQELRRLLQQYQGRSLKDVAVEVQKNEGSGGKSEKAKQVFAMLWLQETCQRSNNSVRRDRVFARYTERCGNERVPTLNPASFGKLVRIIFPNVQTRRLGVRGESKYHYVDLSLVPDENDQGFELIDRPDTSAGLPIERPGSSASITRPLHIQTKPMNLSVVPPRLSMEVADFPTPTTTFRVNSAQDQFKPNESPVSHKLDCQYINTPLIRMARPNMSQNLINILPSIRSNLSATIATYLAMPNSSTLCQPTPNSQESPIELPDIHEYLAGETYDRYIAKLLHDLYRSYCIDVIDAFRKCKDKSFFNHHSAFNGKMTVPVSKLFNLECLAPWIQECDMRMYKQILRYMTPLVLQDVPEQVWSSFDRISSRLVGFLVSSFEEKCPPHVVSAKVVPAARFTNLLKKLRSAQTATLQVSRVLENSQSRTQMWLDVCSTIDPDFVVQDCVPPPESIPTVLGILKKDIRTLLNPEPDPLVEAAEQDTTSLFANFYQDTSFVQGVVPESDASADLLVRLVNWLVSLPQAFQGHHPQCLIDWQTRFFRAIMNQFGAGGALSYQSWWYLENFFHQMLCFMAELEGLLLPSEDQKVLDQREIEKREQHSRLYSRVTSPMDGLMDGNKRKRETIDIGGEERAKSPTLSRPQTAGADTEPEPNSAISGTFPIAHKGTNNNAHNLTMSAPQFVPIDLPPPVPTVIEPAKPGPADAGIDDDDDDMAEINQGGPLDLPSFRTGFTSPMKPLHDVSIRRTPGGLHDDSGIGMAIDEHVAGLDNDSMEAEKEAKKFNKRDWFLSSDPVDPASGVLGALVS